TVLIRGLRPNMTMISQNSHRNGQPRVLHAREGIAIHLKEIQPRHRYAAQVGLLRLLVPREGLALAPIVEKAWPRLLGFADEHYIGKPSEIALLDRDPRPSYHGVDAVPLEFAQNLAHASALYRHSREADNVGASASFEIDWLDVLVNQCDPVLGRGEGSEQGKGS